MFNKRKFNDNAEAECSNEKRSRIECRTWNTSEKSSKLIQDVLAQGPLGEMVIIQHENENAKVVITRAAARSANISVQELCEELPLKVPRIKPDLKCALTINGCEYVTGVFQSKADAKVLFEEALDKLKETCFFIFYKRNYTEISNEEVTSDSIKEKPNLLKVPDSGKVSVAHSMMLKMGWSGAGLGTNEQGIVDPIEATQNVFRQGLGNNKNILPGIRKLLNEFANSSTFSTLAFEPGFSNEERSKIHFYCRKMGLRSKSVGRDENRRITVSKSFNKFSLVQYLLMNKLETDFYKLHIPTRFLCNSTNHC